MAKGNCYEANFNEFTSRVNNKPKYNNTNKVLVHAMREWAGKGSEMWGGHAFILDKDTNWVDDYSNNKHLSVAKDEIFEKWNIQTEGKFMYFEYDYVQAIDKAIETGHYGCWDILFEQWQNENHIEYMKDYFMPKFQPRLHTMYEEYDKKKGVV
jgi:hypothetical protein